MLDKELIINYIKLALIEDVGDGDHTSLATIPDQSFGKAQLIVKEAGIIAGVELAAMIFQLVDPQLKMIPHLQDGSPVNYGDIAFRVEGDSKSILKAERLVLNCMQRMSAIATKTHHLLSIIKDTSTKLLDTRKTTPNFRVFEKWAVAIAGGVNHRFGLYDMILIKDNHVDYAGGISNAIQSSLAYLKKINRDIPIEIEVRNLEELNQVLAIGNIQRIMLDNFSPETLKQAIKIINNTFITEASGGITEENILVYAQTGVNYISVGALTHAVKSIDMSLKAIK